MKTQNTLKAALAVVLAAMAMGAAAQEKGSLTVRIEGLRNSKGTVMIALTEKEIPTDRVIITANMAKADSTGMTFRFDEVPAMTMYAQVFHDENGNYQLEMTPEGRPSEGVGVTPGKPEARPAVTVEVGKENEMTVQMFYFE